MSDWMSKISTPSRYRIVKSKLAPLHLNNAKCFYMSTTFVLLTLLLVLVLRGGHDDTPHHSTCYKIFADDTTKRYNAVYPLAPPVHDKTRRRVIYPLLAIADLDTNSKRPDGKSYMSYVASGTLTLSEDMKEAQIEFNAAHKPAEVHTQYAYGDRGMELSELIVFNGHLYSCDDRTGIVYELTFTEGDRRHPVAVPWVVLVDGDGHSTSKGFKCEWMSVRDEKLYVGGLGKEWTTSKGVFVNTHPQWVKVIGHLGDVSHVDWSENYNAIRRVGGFSNPGYMIFESGVWNNREERWYFLPRRVSKEPYDETLDEKRASNMMVKADAHFHDIVFKPIGEINPLRGYSSFKFVPNSDERLIIALKSEEDNGSTKTYVTLFETGGLILIKDQLLSSEYKYEGIEFA